MNVIDYYLVSKNLDRILRKKKMKREELAFLVGYNSSVLSTYFSGKYSPKATRLQEIAEALEVDVREIFKPVEEWDDEDKAAELRKE